MAKVTEQTAKNYINDAAKYKDAVTKNGEKLKEPIYLQVENMKGTSQKVLDYATDQGVEIIDDISKLPGF